MLAATKESFAKALAGLVRKFEADKEHYLSKSYPEAQARIDFITPLFKALGWDVENEAGLAHHNREVIVERGEFDTTGRPDYSFRVNGQTKFFVEAKAPAERLDEPRHILQAKGYVWNTKTVFFVILTDFEEFRFYDATLKPDERKPDEGLVFPLLKYTEYLKNARKLWEFSRERVAAGSLDAFLSRDRRAARQRPPVDEAFLDEMTAWREELAKNIHKNNPAFTAKQLNEVTQRLLDRIVFIRIAEDRRIIEKRQLADAVDEWKARGGKFEIFDWLRPLFERINDAFNGEIFKPNELVEGTTVDSEVLARIIERLYPPKSLYRFDVIGVELLGSIYERYLGKTIRLTAKQVHLEEKSDVRKAGGVYYTPQYIVDYIVKNTVGKLIEGRSPKQIEKIRILDPACGSGSFLIGAFQCLIDHHTQWYADHPERQARHAHPSLDFMREVQTDPDGSQRLSVYRKAKILRNNLYGVDIDPQAVEITMMSLYLKALEGEKSQLPPKQSLLPPLRNNIICGNSLIGPDIYKDVQLGLFGEEEKERINAFDWNSAEAGFGRIMKEGGFHCVIGNPPYIRIQHMQEWAPVEVEHYKHHYKSASAGNYDIYVVFVEKGLSVLKKKGKLGFILPHKFFNAKYGRPLRALVAKANHLDHVVHFGDQQVFEGATNYTCIMILSNAGMSQCRFVKVDDLQAWRANGSGTEGAIPASRITAEEWNLTVGKSAPIFDKLGAMPVKLGDVAPRIFQGPITSADTIYLFEQFRQKKKKITEVFSRELEEWVPVESGILKAVVRSGSIHRYSAKPTALVLFPYEVSECRARPFTVEEMRTHFPQAWDYLTRNRKELESREGGKFRDKEWYRFGRTQNLGMWEQPKLLTPYMVTKLSAYVDRTESLYFVNVTTGGYGITSGHPECSLEYLCALLNSRLLDFYFKRVSTTFHGGYFAANKQYIEQLPIRLINFSNRADKARHDRVLVLVERMLELNKKKHSGKLAPSQLDRLDREIAATDAEIDDLVYELYGITDQERKVIKEVSLE
jgi:type I restriction-modification system DNA methylase subunit